MCNNYLNRYEFNHIYFVKGASSCIDTHKFHAAACDLYTFGPCDEPCGGGSRMAVTKMCSHSNGDADSPCGIIQVGCNSAPCDGESKKNTIQDIARFIFNWVASAGSVIETCCVENVLYIIFVLYYFKFKLQ